jgi:hypothetical protein
MMAMMRSSLQALISLVKDQFVVDIRQSVILGTSCEKIGSSSLSMATKRKLGIQLNRSRVGAKIVAYAISNNSFADVLATTYICFVIF